MRYYLPIHAKHHEGKEDAPSFLLSVPWWVWLSLVACLLLVVLALR